MTTYYIQSFINDSSLSGIYTGVLYSPQTNEIGLLGADVPPIPGIKVFNLSTGLQVRYGTSAALVGAAGGQLTTPAVVAKDGNIYWSNATGQLCRASFVSLTQNGLFGTPWGGGQNTNNNSLAALGFGAGGLTSVTIGGATFIITKAVLPTNAMSVVDGTAMKWAGYSNTVSETNAGVACAGQVAGGVAYAYLLGYPTGPSTSSLGIYTVAITSGAQSGDVPPGSPVTGTPNSAIALTRGGSIAPSDIDATWTHILTITRPYFDQTDNTVIFGAQTNDSVTHTIYLVKVTPSTGAVVWASPVAALPSGSNTGAEAVIHNGTFGYIEAGQAISVNTSTGAVTQTDLSAAISAGGNNTWSDDNLGLIFTLGTYRESASILPSNTTPSSFNLEYFALSGLITPSPAANDGMITSVCVI